MLVSLCALVLKEDEAYDGSVTMAEPRLGLRVVFVYYGVEKPCL